MSRCRKISCSPRLPALSILGVVLLIAIWIAATRFETRYPVEYRAANLEGSDVLEIFSLSGRGVTLRDLVALGLVTPPTGKAPVPRRKKAASEAPKSDET